MLYETAEACREAGITYHLVPASVWNSVEQEWYTPEAFDADGFIHCTNGTQELVAVANMFYTADPRAFSVLALQMDAIESPVRYDDPGKTYPHIYGPLNASAVIGKFNVTRSDDGTFMTIGAAS